ncbi:MAG: hypothetical protein MUP57_05545, partial [Clostridia bacterium]|nr:hypothetical protein [Clostridia bacterium]
RISGSFNIEGYIDLPLVKKREHVLQLSKVRAIEALRDEFLLQRSWKNINILYGIRFKIATFWASIGYYFHGLLTS